MDIYEASLSELRTAIASGKLTCLGLTQYYLHRIEKFDPQLKAVITLNPSILAEAAQCDVELAAGRSRGPLHGIPLVIKDTIDVQGMPTTCGTRALANFIPRQDAAAVARLKAAGALILAKTNLSELGMHGMGWSTLGGQVLNPYDLTRTPGGSSSGTAVMVSCNMAAAGLGTDGVNSIRSPASAVNVVGFRSSTGLISRKGSFPNRNEQDNVGPICRSVADVALLLEIMAGYDPDDPLTESSRGQEPIRYTQHLNPNGLANKRFGVLTEYLGQDVQVLSVMDSALKTINVCGGAVLEVNDFPTIRLSHLFKENDMMFYNMKDAIDQYFAMHGDNAPYTGLADMVEENQGISPPLFAELRRGSTLELGAREPEYIKRHENNLRLREELTSYMDEKGLDAFIYPHQSSLVALVGDDSQKGRNGVLAAVTGMPAVVVPGGFSQPTRSATQGIPVGVEFLGRYFADKILVEIAYGFEQNAHWRQPPDDFR